MKATLSYRIRRRAWRFFLHWRFQLLDRHRLKRPLLEEVAGKTILVLPDVFHPKLFGTGEFMAANLGPERIPPGSRVLDLGTGSGIGAVVAAGWARQVVAVDLNPAAARCARLNAILNRVEDRVDVRVGDLFEPVAGERFDVVLFNPPYFRGKPRNALDQAFYSDDVAERFASSLATHLTAEGRAWLLLSSEGDEKSFLEPLANHGFRIAIQAERSAISEVFRLYEVRRQLDR